MFFLILRLDIDNPEITLSMLTLGMSDFSSLLLLAGRVFFSFLIILVSFLI